MSSGKSLRLSRKAAPTYSFIVGLHTDAALRKRTVVGLNEPIDDDGQATIVRFRKTPWQLKSGECCTPSS
jgi:hypothetical protein